MFKVYRKKAGVKIMSFDAVELKDGYVYPIKKYGNNNLRGSNGRGRKNLSRT
jgi:hypothetical protein